MNTETIELTEYEARFIRDAVDEGLFRDATEFLRAGIRLMIQQYDVDSLPVEELRALIDEGDASGESDRTAEEIVADARVRYLRRDTQ